MKRIIHYLLSFSIMNLSVTASERRKQLDVAYVLKLQENLKVAKELRNNGKTVKAERLAEETWKAGREYFSAGTVFKFPQNCLFTNNSEANELNGVCVAEGKILSLSIKYTLGKYRPDKRSITSKSVAERIQDISADRNASTSDIYELLDSCRQVRECENADACGNDSESKCNSNNKEICKRRDVKQLDDSEKSSCKADPDKFAIRGLSKKWQGLIIEFQVIKGFFPHNDSVTMDYTGTADAEFSIFGKVLKADAP